MFFERFRKPRWQHANPEIRKQALLKLSADNPGEAEVLLRLAAEDPEADVRRSAVKRVSDLDFLRQRAHNDPNAGVREVASARYRQLVAGGTDEADLKARLAELDRCADESVLTFVARRGREPELRIAALERLNVPSVLEDAVMNDDAAKVRQAAVERLREPEALERIARLTREKDRKVAKLARDALDEIRRRQRLNEEARQARELLCAAAEALAEAPWREGYIGEKLRLENRWQAIAVPAEDAPAERFRAAIAKCEQRIDEAARHPVAVPVEAPLAPVAVAAPVEAESEPEALPEAPEPPAAEPAPTPMSAEDAARRAEQRAAASALLESLDRALAEGHVKDAQRLLAKAHAFARELSGGEQQRLERRLKPYAGRVRELQDWRQFATLPKQEALCAQMEALIDADMPPAERAERIRALQDQWKATGGSGSPAQRQLWERFRAAADKAFEPCRAYFDELAQQKQRNLEQRTRIADQLEGFVAAAQWDALALAVLEEIRAQARREWQAAAPVDRKAGANVEGRFEGHMQTLTDRIHDKQEGHRQRKNALLTRAQALVDAADLRAAINEIKDLQAQWKAVGPAQPSAERKLWREFRAACDALFARRDSERTQVDAERQAQIAHARQLCEQAEALATASDDQLDAAKSQLAQFQRELDAVAGLPREEQRALRERMNKVESGLTERGREIVRRQRQAELASVEQRAALCARLEAEVLRAPAEAEARMDAWQAEWDALPPATADAEPGLAARWRQAVAAAASGGFSDEFLAQQLQHRRELCVRLEILAGVESPAEDRALRMDLQVKRLAEGMTGGARERPQTSARKLHLEWLAAGPVPASAQSLEARFQAALAAVR